MKRIERPKIDPYILRQLTKVQRQTSGESIILLKNGAETIEYLHIKKKRTSVHIYAIYKSLFSMDHRPKCKTRTVKILQENRKISL